MDQWDRVCPIWSYANSFHFIGSIGAGARVEYSSSSPFAVSAGAGRAKSRLAPVLAPPTTGGGWRAKGRAPVSALWLFAWQE